MKNLKHLVTGLALAVGLSAGIAMAHVSAADTGGVTHISTCTNDGDLCTKSCSAGFHGEIMCFNGYPRCTCVPN